VAAKLVMDTVRDEEVDGREKEVTVGGVVSELEMVTVAERLVEIFPAASLAQA
jgi:hypothetical protein